MSASSFRLSVFVFTLLSCALAEHLLPRRARVAPTAPRWGVNLALMLLCSLTVRFLLPLAAMETAALAETSGIGLMNLAAIPSALKILLTIVLFDLLIYWQHRIFHRVPALWRLHAVHHTDLDLDAGSSVRFHPLEILVSMLIKITAVILLGASATGVLIFETILSTAAIFHHSNIALPLPFDAVLRWLTVTPDIHRIHHSPNRVETDSNFSFNLTLWDRLFGTYRAQPLEPHESMSLGLPEDRDPNKLGLIALLVRPMRSS